MVGRFVLFCWTSALWFACASAPAPFADPLTISYAPVLGVDLNTATRLRNGMYVHDVRVGAGATATRGSEARLHYSLFLPDGKQVQTSRDSDPMLTRLDDASFLIREAVVGMRVGGRRTIVVPPAQGYGRAGVPGLVPPNTTIVFDIELLEVRS